MDVKRFDELARRGDDSREACGVRARAAIIAAGYSSNGEFARETGQTANAISNGNVGLVYPSRRTMLALYRRHRIDPTFIMIGEYSQLRGDVQRAIFEALCAEGK